MCVSVPRGSSASLPASPATTSPAAACLTYAWSCFSCRSARVAAAVLSLEEPHLGTCVLSRLPLLIIHLSLCLPSCHLTPCSFHPAIDSRRSQYKQVSSISTALCQPVSECTSQPRQRSTGFVSCIQRVERPLRQAAADEISRHQSGTGTSNLYIALTRAAIDTSFLSRPRPCILLHSTQPFRRAVSSSLWLQGQTFCNYVKLASGLGTRVHRLDLAPIMSRFV